MLWLAAVSLFVWVALLCFRGGFWRFRTEARIHRAAFATVTVVIPARDEAEVIGAAVSSLVTQEYAGELHVFVVDDHSTDGTAEKARASAATAGRSDRLTVIEAADLPAGWTGKLWAMSQGLETARSFSPDYVLLTDADIEHASDIVAGLVARAEDGNYDLVSLMAELRCESVAEKALIPAFVFFFFKLYPPKWVSQPHARTAAAAGGCMLVHYEAFERIGGIESIRGALIDDCTLAAAIKRTGGSIRLGLTHSVRSLRKYGTWPSVWRMISRSAFTQLGYSSWLLLGTVAGMFVTYLAPPLLTFTGSGPARWMGLAAWGLMTVAYLPAVRFYGLSPLWAPSLPLVALFYLGATVDSALRYWVGSGGTWKGRVQARKA